MKEQDLRSIGINSCSQMFYNLSYDELFKHETDASLTGYERGVELRLDCPNREILIIRSLITAIEIGRAVEQIVRPLFVPETHRSPAVDLSR